jgi:hypothetical protein
LAAQSLCISRAYLHRLIRPASEIAPEEASVAEFDPDYQYAPLGIAQ